MKKKGGKDWVLFCLLSFILMCSFIFYLFSNLTKESLVPQTSSLNKTVWILWLQGWENAPWLSQQVAESWRVKNPGWKVVLLNENNLKDYLDDVNFLARESISPAAKSDIVRLNMLYKHGGVWADATLLCMRSLDVWVDKAVNPSNFWMYHGNGAGMKSEEGPASWFMISKARSYIISKWKHACNEYWEKNDSTENYFWMDGLFKILYENDKEFKRQWDATPYIDAEDPGQSHLFANGSWSENTEELKNLLDESPPHVLKLWNGRWEAKCPDDALTPECLNSNGYYAIQVALRPA